jgi:hypothetical protein
MKSEGINNALFFILKESSPILELGQNGIVEESDKKLLKGTVVKGQLKTRIVNVKGDKIPYRFIQLSDKKGYISPRMVNLYIGKFANFDNADVEEDKTKETEPYKNPKKTKNIIINWGLPIGGAVLGYYVGKKMEAEPKKLVGYVIFFTLIGFLPRYLYKN